MTRVDEVALRIIDRMRSSTLGAGDTGDGLGGSRRSGRHGRCPPAGCPAGSGSRARRAAVPGRSSSAWSSVTGLSTSLAEVLGGRSAASLRTSHPVTTCEDLPWVFPGGIRTCPAHGHCREFGLATWLPSWPASKYRHAQDPQGRDAQSRGDRQQQRPASPSSAGSRGIWPDCGWVRSDCSAARWVPSKGQLQLAHPLVCDGPGGR